MLEEHPPAAGQAIQNHPPDTRALRQRAETLLAQLQDQLGSAPALSAAQLAATVHELHVHQIELEMQNEELRRAQVALRASRAAYADLYHQVPVGYLSLDASGRIVRANPLAARLLGTEHSALLNQPLSNFVTHDDQDILYLLRKQGPESTQPRNAELHLRRADGTLFWAELIGTDAPHDGGPAHLLVALNDISERKAAQHQLNLAASVFSQAREGIMITDTSGHIVDVNAAFSRITGYSRDDVLGKKPTLLNSGRQSAGYFAAMWQELVKTGYWQGEIWNRRQSGEVYAELQTITTVRDALGTPTHYVSLFTDITAEKVKQQQLEHMVHHDVLTGLPNRVLLTDRLLQHMAQAQRHGRLLAVVYMDLDSFKTINDLHGHDAGDQLLMALAARLGAVLRDCDTLARPGGDEFVAVITELADTAAGLPLLTRLLAAASQPHQIGEDLLQVSASMGVTFYPQAEPVVPDQLLRQADQAMYQAKLTGKNRYHLFDQAHDRSLRGHHEGLERVRQALAQHELVLYYQPKVNMRTGVVLGAEALIRWQHPQRGLLAPAEFLPLIDADPLAIAVGEWVIDTALAQLARWQAAGLDLHVSVNVGALQLQQPNFVARLQAIMQRYPGVGPGNLMIEVLETSALQDIGYVSQVIEDCRQMGVAFALDDFGTGYSSLTYLKRLRVTVVKIDKSFVRDMLEDPDDQSILLGVISLANAFGREVIAEGVETVAHGSLLLQLGCDQAQGYGIAHPMPADTLPGWVASWLPDAAWASASDGPGNAQAVRRHPRLSWRT